MLSFHQRIHNHRPSEVKECLDSLYVSVLTPKMDGQLFVKCQDPAKPSQCETDQNMLCSTPFSLMHQIDDVSTGITGRLQFDGKTASFECLSRGMTPWQGWIPFPIALSSPPPGSRASPHTFYLLQSVPTASQICEWAVHWIQVEFLLTRSSVLCRGTFLSSSKCCKNQNFATSWTAKVALQKKKRLSSRKSATDAPTQKEIYSQRFTKTFTQVGGHQSCPNPSSSTAGTRCCGVSEDNSSVMRKVSARETSQKTFTFLRFVHLHFGSQLQFFPSRGDS